MRTSPQRVRFWLLLILLCGLSAQAADTRLGLVTLGGKTDDLADLLTAELSKLPGVELVERRELRRIMEEQGLSSMTSANAVKLGKLARADALLLMDPGATNVVQIRLVSPVAGAVLRNTPVTWPATNTTEIAGTLAKLLQRDMERLANLSSNATLVTIAGFKAALKGSAGAGAEESQGVGVTWPCWLPCCGSCSGGGPQSHSPSLRPPSPRWLCALRPAEAVVAAVASRGRRGWAAGREPVAGGGRGRGLRNFRCRWRPLTRVTRGRPVGGAGRRGRRLGHDGAERRTRTAGGASDWLRLQLVSGVVLLY